MRGFLLPRAAQTLVSSAFLDALGDVSFASAANA
jgi:hypothetical protein